jgi:DNA-binding transcriptional ArsR family regulator
MSADPYAALERIFHEPRRLAIMSALLGAPDGLSFRQLKESCDLTDGNLSRHLKALQEAGAVAIDKSFVKNRPRTTVFLSDQGRESFAQYLSALEEVLVEAAGKLAPEQEQQRAPAGAVTRLAEL